MICECKDVSLKEHFFQHKLSPNHPYCGRSYYCCCHTVIRGCSCCWIQLTRFLVSAGRNLKKDGREEGVEQVLPTGLWSVEASQSKKAKEPADQGPHDASDEHSMQHLRQLHLQRNQVQFQKGRCYWRGLIIIIIQFQFQFFDLQYLHFSLICILF